MRKWLSRRRIRIIPRANPLPGYRLNIKTILSGIPIIKIKLSNERFIFIMGIPLLVRSCISYWDIPKTAHCSVDETHVYRSAVPPLLKQALIEQQNLWFLPYALSLLHNFKKVLWVNNGVKCQQKVAQKTLHTYAIFVVRFHRPRFLWKLQVRPITAFTHSVNHHVLHQLTKYSFSQVNCLPWRLVKFFSQVFLGIHPGWMRMYYDIDGDDSDYRCVHKNNNNHIDSRYLCLTFRDIQSFICWFFLESHTSIYWLHAHVWDHASLRSS